jgi:tRNA(fMet)-specific endonuclease VapC
MASLCMSSITEGELLSGLAKRPTAAKLHAVVRELLLRVDVLPWDRAAAQSYGPARAAMVREGRTLAPLDLLIGTHARSIGAVLVSGDKAFGMVPGLAVEDWG